MPPENIPASPVRISLPLPFQQEIFQEIRKEDRLVVLARGLGLLRVISNLLHSYDAAGDNLVLIVGANENELEWIGEALTEHATVSRAPKARGLHVVNTDSMSAVARQRLYRQGGVLAITSRIMIVDLLTDQLVPNTITGMVVLHADRLVATSLEAFILRIYRQKNKTGFIKAFSDNPEPFTTGFSPLTTMLRNLHLRTPSLWPRFHVSVSESLEVKKADVIELSVSMTDSMHEIQTAILQCIEASLSEIRKGNSKELDMEEWDVDSALHRSFDIVVRRQLDPVWHRVSYKTKQIVNDLTTLRKLLDYLVAYDSVTFYKWLESIIFDQEPQPGSTRQNQSPWLFLDAGQVIFTAAKRRAYTGNIPAGSSTNDRIPAGLVPVLEEQPKWEILSTVLEEIERDTYFHPSIADESYGTILIMCEDHVCSQLREYLQTMNISTADEGELEDKETDRKQRLSSASYMMRRKLRGYVAWKRDLPRLRAMWAAENNKTKGSSFNTSTRQPQDATFRGRPPPNKRRRTRGGSAAALTNTSRTSGSGIQISDETPFDLASLTEGLRPTEDEQKLKEEIASDTFENFADYYELNQLHDAVVVHPFSGDMDDRLLEELRPRYIVMYSPDTAFVRRVEVYRSSHRNRQVKVYFLYYGESVEEQRFLSAVRREKDAFSKLIKERGRMTVTLTTDALAVDNPQEEFLRTINTRIAGGGRLAATAEPPKVVVDVREFRSSGSLPSLLHGRHMTIIPCLLTVGDYIITPDICVERKSIKDLISSFKDGRLYNQCESMLQYYKQPMLLIEFDQNKAFTLEPFSEISPSTGQGDLQSKLVLLTLNFPKVKIIWSSSPYQTAEIFEDLKKNHEEPDVAKAVRLGLDDGEDPMNPNNQTPRDMLRAVPGITDKNYKLVMNEVENMLELASMSEKDISEIIGVEAGRKVHRFFNRSM